GLAGGGLVLLPDVFGQSTTALVRAPRRALVIGNGAYSGATLSNPRNDAQSIGEELKRAGFEVTTALDLDRARMTQAIDAHGAALARDKAVGVFYFAGHGLQLAWRNYLVPVDARVGSIEDVKARCVDLSALLDGIARASNPMNVIILDACRDN